MTWHVAFGFALLVDARGASRARGATACAARASSSAGGGGRPRATQRRVSRSSACAASPQLPRKVAASEGERYTARVRPHGMSSMRASLPRRHPRRGPRRRLRAPTTPHAGHWWQIGRVQHGDGGRAMGVGETRGGISVTGSAYPHRRRHGGCALVERAVRRRLEPAKPCAAHRRGVDACLARRCTHADFVGAGGEGVAVAGCRAPDDESADLPSPVCAQRRSGRHHDDAPRRRAPRRRCRHHPEPSVRVRRPRSCRTTSRGACCTRTALHTRRQWRRPEGAGASS